MKPKLSHDRVSSGDVFEESTEDLYEAAPCGYLSTAPNGRIIKVNGTLSDWLGFEQGEMTGGMHLLDLLSVGGKIFYETHFSLLLRMHGHVDEIAFDLTCKNGRTLATLVSAKQKQNAAGKPVVNRLTVFNATERKSYERELLQARKRTEETNAELSRVNAELAASNSALLKANDELAQFAYAASHDLQEPLRNISVYTQLLARRSPDGMDEDAETFMRYILDGANTMRLLIDDLLSFSQTQSSGLVMRKTEMDLVLSIALENLRSSIETSRATVTYKGLPQVTVDASRLVQVFQNLIGNAIKYCKPGVPPHIQVSAVHPECEDLVFTVEDNGIGFDGKYSEQIFGLFKRLHGREIPGTGIGLAICRKIVELHGGRIWATSTPGVGSRFSFSIAERSPN